MSHPERKISLYLCNFSKELRQLTDWQTYKNFGIGSEKFSSHIQFWLRLVWLRKVSLAMLSSQIKFWLRLNLLQKNINFLHDLHWNFGEWWRFPTGVLHLDFDLDMVTDLWYTYDPNAGFLFWFCRCKENPCPIIPHLGVWRILEVPDWSLAPWSWFGNGHWSLICPWSEFLFF